MPKTKLSYEDLKTLRDANNSVKGTNEYTKYWMEMSSKYMVRDRLSGWKFMGHGIPVVKSAKIKKFKDKVYIVTEDAYGYNRWEVTDEVNDLLNIY